MDFTEELAARRVLAVVRAPRIGAPDRLADALASMGGLIEVTLTVEDALAAIASLAGREGTIVGAGTVLDAEQAQAAIDAGARYLVTPAVVPETIAVATAAGVPAIAGALTPTEVVAARRAGATAIKLFPASLGGPGYLRELRGPLPDVPLVPSGGVSADNAGEYLEAGALAVSCGGSVAPAGAIAAGDWAAIAERAAVIASALAPYRAVAS